MPKGTVVSVLNASKRQGTSDKGVAWNIMEVEVEKDDGAIVHADTFDTVVDGDVVELTPNSYTSPKTGKTYDGWNAKVPKAQNSFSKPAGPDQAEVLQAIRMLYREIKEVNRKVDLLMGPPDEDSKPNEEGEPSAKPPARDWTSVGQESDPNEPHLEPMPDEPQDLESFMNG